MNVFSVFDDTVTWNKEHNLSLAAPGSQHEGNARVFLHIQDLVRSGHNVVKVRTVYIAVIAIRLASFQMISVLQVLRVEFGKRKAKISYTIHELYLKRGANRAKAIKFFCIVSFFCFCKKLNAWNTWINFPEVTKSFVQLSSLHAEKCVIEPKPMMERYFALIYYRTRTCLPVNEAIREMFLKDSRDLKKIPPTGAAFFQHESRASFIVCYVRHQSLIPSASLPNIGN